MLKAEELDLGLEDPSLLDDNPAPASASASIKSKKDLLQELRFKQVRK